ncbi:uncharacterized protein METZ01_LOCUS353453, partial [marine metagenome]
VELVLARTTFGMTEASATRMFSSPCTRQYWSTTALLSEAGPNLQVPELWVVLTVVRSIHASKVSLDSRSASLGCRRSSMMFSYNGCSTRSMASRTHSRMRCRSQASSK